VHLRVRMLVFMFVFVFVCVREHLQLNGRDCGVYVCMFAEHLLHGHGDVKGLHEVVKGDPARHVATYRQKIKAALRLLLDSRLHSRPSTDDDQLPAKRVAASR
jgi:hypothetical protein